MEEEFERLRYDQQGARLELLFASGKARPGLSLEEARRQTAIQQWLSRTLVESLVRCA